MRRFLCGFLAFIMIFASLSGMAFSSYATNSSASGDSESDTTEATVSSPFPVFDGAWYNPDGIPLYNSVCSAFFGLTGGMTRAQASFIFAKLLGINTTGYIDSVYDDIDSNCWYSTACNWAAKIGCFDSEGMNKFEPKKPVSAEELTYLQDNVAQMKQDFLQNIHQVAHNAGEWYEYSKLVYTCITSSSDEAKTEANSVIHDKRGIAANIDTYALNFASLCSVMEAGQVSYMGAIRDDGQSDALVYTSSNPDVAEYCYGDIMYAKRPGYTTITATSSDGLHKVSSIVQVTASSLMTVDENGRTKRVFDPSKPAVAITFDDGPGVASDVILDVLEKYNVTATFFEQGKNVYYYPETVKREVELGCEIGNHSYNHSNLSKLSASGVAKQMNDTNQAFIEACGFAPKLMRPPYGARNATVNQNVGMPEIFWAVDTLDWKYRDPEYVLGVIKDQAEDGDVILMHSVHETTGQAIESIVVWLLSQGYQLVNVSELAEGRGYTLEAGNSYDSFPIKEG